jgi:gliding motility-associated-like protein
MKNLCVTLILSILTSFATAKENWIVKPFERKAFIENKGQFNRMLPKEYRGFSYCIDNSAQVFFYKNKIMYRFTKRIPRKHKLTDVLKSEEALEQLERSHTAKIEFIDVEWLNTNTNVTIEVGEVLPTVYSYLQQNKANENYTEMCTGYKKITYKNMYNNIDVEYMFHPANGIKYNIIAHKGANLSQIKIKYTGQKNIALINNELRITTIAGTIIEKQPVSYLLNNTQQIVPSAYALNENIVSFNLNNYNDAIVIDPLVLVPKVKNGEAYDNGVDALGNVYVYGGSQRKCIAEKYAPTGGLPLWSLNYTYTSGYIDYSTGLDTPYYGDLLVEKAGTFYISQGANQGVTGAHTVKFNTNSAVIWTSSSDPDFREHWRLALDCKHGKVIVAGGGTTFPTKNIAEINVNTGALRNVKSMYNSTSIIYDMAGLCVEPSGKCFLLGGTAGPKKDLIFTSDTLSPIAKVTSGHPFNEANNGYLAYINSNGFNCMALSGNTLLYTYDGSKLKKWNRQTHLLIDSTYVPFGIYTGNSGVLADDCGNVFVGVSTGVHRYNANLVQQEFEATDSLVYDIAFTPNGNIIACGYGHVTELSFTIPPCIFKKNPDIKPVCNGANNGSIKLNVTGGVPTYTYVWTKNGAPYAATTDSIGGLTAGVYFCTVTDNLCPTNNIDTVTIVVTSIVGPTISYTKKDATCYNKNNGEIAVTIAPATPGYSVRWIPTINSIGDSLKTLSIHKLDTGRYVVIVDALKCIFKDTIHISQPDSLILKPLINVSHCPNNSVISPINAIVTGGTMSYTYNWAGSNVAGSTTTLSTLNITTDTTLNISVNVSDANGCKSSTQKMRLTINPNPIANFVTDSVCFNSPTHFTDSSKIKKGKIKTWSWIFAGTNTTPQPTSTDSTPIFTYDKCNNAANGATLVVTSDSGCVGAISKQVMVYCLPTANFTVNNGCEHDDTIKFTNTSTNGLGTTGNLINRWNLGLTQFQLSVKNPKQVYPTTGLYNASLIVKDVHKCTATLSKLITIYPKPSASFKVDSVCLNSPTSFTNTSTIIVPKNFNDAINGYKWDYNFNNVFTQDATTINASNTYNASATSTMPMVSLIIKTNNNCFDTVTKPVIVWPLPKPLYTISTACYPNPVSFANATTIATGTNNSSVATTNLYWGNGQVQSITSNTQSLNYNYAASGNYISKLVVASNHGCLDSLTLPVVIHAKPKASFTFNPAQGCAPLCVSFTNTSIQANAPITETIANTTWAFGDYNAEKASDDKTSKPNPTHCYANKTDTTQAHTPQLIVSTSAGCMDTLIVKNGLEVYPLPTANFSVNPSTVTMYEPMVQLNDKSHLATTLLWNYGNNVLKSMNNTSPLNPLPAYNYIYTDSGTYTILQTVITNKGCRDSITKPVRVNPIYSIYVPNSFTPNGDGVNDYFMPRGENIKDLTLIIFDRYGELIARIQGANSKGWDGKDIRFDLLSQQEVYNWKLEYTDVFNVLHKGLVGTVTLIK